MSEQQPHYYVTEEDSFIFGTNQEFTVGNNGDMARRARVLREEREERARTRCGESMVGGDQPKKKPIY